MPQTEIERCPACGGDILRTSDQQGSPSVTHSRNGCPLKFAIECMAWAEVLALVRRIEKRIATEFVERVKTEKRRIAIHENHPPYEAYPRAIDKILKEYSE